MRQIIDKLAEACREAVEKTAYESYYNGVNPNSFDGCCCSVKLYGCDAIEVSCYNDGTYEVFICHKESQYLNVEQAIADYLGTHADPLGAWQEADDDNIYEDVDPGCDPAFPHYGDFERWAYGY